MPQATLKSKITIRHVFYLTPSDLIHKYPHYQKYYIVSNLTPDKENICRRQPNLLNVSYTNIKNDFLITIYDIFYRHKDMH